MAYAAALEPEKQQSLVHTLAQTLSPAIRRNWDDELVKSEQSDTASIIKTGHVYDIDLALAIGVKEAELRHVKVCVKELRQMFKAEYPYEKVTEAAWCRATPILTKMILTRLGYPFDKHDVDDHSPLTILECTSLVRSALVKLAIQENRAPKRPCDTQNEADYWSHDGSPESSRAHQSAHLTPQREHLAITPQSRHSTSYNAFQPATLPSHGRKFRDPDRI